MTETRIQFRLSVPIEVFPEGNVFVAGCESLQVYSQGATFDEARENVEEALGLFVTSCFERGTLERVLLDSGFAPDIHSDVFDVDDESGEMIHVPLHLVAHAEANAA